MQAEQLMIGDWVLDPFGEPTRISAIHNFDDVEINKDLDSNQYFAAAVIDLDPIPITGEILEKNGFEKEADYLQYRFYLSDKRLRSKNITITPLDDEWEEVDVDILHTDAQFQKSMKYVHELQHALRLCGIEKDIEL